MPTYDANGNQTLVKTATGIWTALYDANNRPVHFEKTEGETVTVVECGYDSMGRRYMKKVTVNGTVTLHHRYIYRGYLQIACCDLTRSAHPCLWLITWDPAEGEATRPLAIQKDGTWYTYGLDITKNVWELFSNDGHIRTTYDYTPYGGVTANGSVTQPLQWSSEVYDAELAMVYYNYRHYNPMDGRWINRDPIGEKGGRNLYRFLFNNGIYSIDLRGFDNYVIGDSQEPQMSFDEDYVYDPNEKASLVDHWNWNVWGVKASAAQTFRNDLKDAVEAYLHYRHGNGSDLNIAYFKAYREDDNIRSGVNKDIAEAQKDAEKLWDGKVKSFNITGQAVRLGDPSTENWQKTVGKHWIWGHAKVETCIDGDPNKFGMTITIHEKDRYNFNRGALDIATNTPDEINGRFAVLGWAHSFFTNGTVVRHVTWTKGNIAGSSTNNDPPR